MKKTYKIGIAALTISALTATLFLANNQVFAAETTRELTVLTGKYVNGQEIIKGKYTADDYKTFDLYYSDGYFANDPNEYQPHLATLATQLTDASTTYIENGNYSNGDKNIKNALYTLGFDGLYGSDSYKVKPTTDSIACEIGYKELYNMKYDYLVDITVRSASYEAEWASNVTLGKTGEAQGFKEAADQVTYTYFAKQYLDQYPQIKNALNNGKVAFFVNGFSRGGATANLTAKRLIDNYQDEGNAVFAYCIEAPQGGIKQEIRNDRDYKGIHNVINPNDLVCYVAPEQMGFMRYGIDHYIYGDMLDEISQNGYIFNTPCDNRFDTRQYETLKAQNIAELKKMLNTDNVSKYEPYDMTYYKVDLRNKEVVKTNNNNYTFNFIRTFFDRLMYKNGKMVVDRAKYADNIEPLVRNFMALNSNKAFKDINGISSYFTLSRLGSNAIFSIISNIKVSAPDTTNPIVIAWRVATGSENLIYTIDFNEDFRKDLAGYVKKMVASQDKLCDILEKNYPTKTEGALKDIYNLVYTVTAGSNNLDNLVTFALNAQNIIRNHSTYQTIAWLRMADELYQGNAHYNTHTIKVDF